MRSPWKFLTDLRSRRNPAKSKAGSGADHEKPAIGDDQGQREQPVVRPAVAETETDAVARGSDETPSAREQATAKTAAEEQDLHTDASSSPVVRRRARASGAYHARALTSGVAGAAPEVRQGQSAQVALFEDVSLLDAEIRHLRIELAGKLRMQNRQLRKMLERFDP